MCFHSGMTRRFVVDWPNGRGTDDVETLEILNELEQTFRVTCQHLVYKHQVPLPSVTSLFGGLLRSLSHSSSPRDSLRSPTWRTDGMRRWKTLYLVLVVNMFEHL